VNGVEAMAGQTETDRESWIAYFFEDTLEEFIRETAELSVRV